MQPAHELVPVHTPEDIEKLPAEQAGVMITRALEASKSWLAVAMKGTDPTSIAEFKAWAATAAEMSRQRGLAKGIQLDALEMYRRADRGLGVSIRNGQVAGEVRVPHASGGPRVDYVRAGRPVHIPSRDQLHEKNLVSPSTFFSGGADMSATYAMTDGVTDERFEQAVTEGRAENNLSRANVIRKIRDDPASVHLSREQKAEKIRELAALGWSSQQIGPELNTGESTIREIARSYDIEIPADRVLRKTKRVQHDPERIIREAVLSVNGIEYGINLLSTDDFNRLDSALIRDWLAALEEPARAIRHLIKELKTRV